MATPHRRTLLTLLLLGALRVHSADTPAPAPEPLIASISPISMRTEASRTYLKGRSTVITPAKESTHGPSDLSVPEFNTLDITWEQFLQKATDAADRLLLTLEPDITKDEKGTPLYATLKSTRHHTPSIILSEKFREKFAPLFGDKLVAVAPDQFTVYVFPRSFSGFQDFGKRLIAEHEAALYPCSLEAWEITPDGCTCLGSYADGPDKTPPPTPPAKPSKPKARR